MARAAEVAVGVAAAVAGVLAVLEAVVVALVVARAEVVVARRAQVVGQLALRRPTDRHGWWPVLTLQIDPAGGQYVRGPTARGLACCMFLLLLVLFLSSRQNYNQITRRGRPEGSAGDRGRGSRGEGRGRYFPFLWLRVGALLHHGVGVVRGAGQSMLNGTRRTTRRSRLSMRCGRAGGAPLGSELGEDDGRQCARPWLASGAGSILLSAGTTHFRRRWRPATAMI